MSTQDEAIQQLQALGIDVFEAAEGENAVNWDSLVRVRAGSPHRTPLIASYWLITMCITAFAGRVRESEA